VAAEIGLLYSTPVECLQDKDKKETGQQLSPSLSARAADLKAGSTVEQDASHPPAKFRKRSRELESCGFVGSLQATDTAAAGASAANPTWTCVPSTSQVAQDNSSPPNAYPYPITSKDKDRLVHASQNAEHWPTERLVDHIYNINASETCNDPQPQCGDPRAVVKQQQKRFKEGREARRTALRGVVRAVLAANEGVAITGPDTVMCASFEVAGKHGMKYMCLSTRF
jgi:hypothetical protein